MRLKVSPRDFRVEELIDFRDEPGGEYFVHRLRKSKRGTVESIAYLAELAGVERADVAFAGLKDRQGITEQFVSIRGARIDYSESGLQVRCVGRSHRPLTSKMSRGNRFTVALRDLSASEARVVRAAAEEVVRDGFPNYFDDQRFGSLRHGQGLVMRAVLRGDHERALRQLIASPSPVASGGDVRLKRFFAANWGDWEKCAEVARGPVWARLFEALRRAPTDFHGALAALPTRLKLIHSYAFQSLLWNRAVSRWLEPQIPVAVRTHVHSIAGRWSSWSHLDGEAVAAIRSASTPLFGPGGAGGDPQFAEAMAAVLADAGVEPAKVAEHGVPGMAWREEARPALVIPLDFRLSTLRDRRDRVDLELRFALPRGAYATMLVKRLAAEPRERRGGSDARRRGRPPAGRDERVGPRADRGKRRDRGDGRAPDPGPEPASGRFHDWLPQARRGRGVRPQRNPAADAAEERDA